MNYDIISIASKVGQDWVDGEYYDCAEVGIESQWQELIWPIISDADFSYVLEIAAGHGRNTAKLLTVARMVVASDINESNISFLQERFAEYDNVEIMQNNGADLRSIKGGSVSFVYCFDAMVHFDCDVIRSYIKEIRRILKPGGRAFCHYSVYDKNPTGTYRDHPGWRNFMSQQLFEHWVAKEGMRPIKSIYVKAAQTPTIEVEGADGVTYFELPLDAPSGIDFVDIVEELSTQLEGLKTQYEILLTQMESLRRKSEQDDCCHANLTARLRAIETSTSWRLTAPVRKLVSIFRNRS
jgi:ubiquinone/menaquinone biosynthesis C-methylase UbiE